MPTRLVPVDYDPFAESHVTLTPVDFDPFDVAQVAARRNATIGPPPADPRDVAAQGRVARAQAEIRQQDEEGAYMRRTLDAQQADTRRAEPRAEHQIDEYLAAPPVRTDSIYPLNNKAAVAGGLNPRSEAPNAVERHEQGRRRAEAEVLSGSIYGPQDNLHYQPHVDTPDSFGQFWAKAGARAWAEGRSALGGLIQWADEANASGDLVEQMLPVPTAMGLVPTMPQEYKDAVHRAYAEARANGQVNGQQMYDAAQHDLETNQFSRSNPEAVRYVGMITDSVGLMAPTIAISLATRSPAAGAAAMGVLSGGQQYADERAMGRNYRQASLGGIIYGTAEALPEMIPLEAMMRPGGHFLLNTLRTAGFEGGSEIMTQVVETGYDMNVIHPGMTWGEAWGQLKDAGIVGFFMGAGMHVGAHPINRAMETVLERRRARAQGVVDEAIDTNQHPGSQITPRTGIKEEAAAAAPNITPEDHASPLPTDLIAEGKGVIDEVLAGAQADDIVNRNGGHEIGDKVSLTMGGQERTGTIKDAFIEDDPETGQHHGAVIEWDHGVTTRERFADLHDAGARIRRTPLNEGDQPGRFAIAGGFTVGDGYGARRGHGTHHGVDTFAPVGTPFHIGHDFDVIESHRQAQAHDGRDGGNIATVRFPDGSEWFAMHLPDLPRSGHYAAGSPIIRAGATGSATEANPHVHWQPVNDLAHTIYDQGRRAVAAYLTGGAAPGGAVAGGEAATPDAIDTSWINRPVDQAGAPVAVTTPAAQPLAEGERGPAIGAVRTTPFESTTTIDVNGEQRTLNVSAPAGTPLGDGTRAAPIEATTAEHVDQAAAQAHPEPTEAQAEAGNYAHGHVRVQGLDISIENARGSERRGVGPDGTPWSVTMPSAYGYVKRTEGQDGEQVDVYVGDHPTEPRVYVIDQVHADTKAPDEHKAMIGFPSEEAALATYHQAFSDGKGPDRVGAVTPMDMSQFKDWLKSGDTQAPASSAQLSDITGQLESAPGGMTESVTPSEDFNAEDHVEAMRQYVANSTGSLNDTEKMGKALGLTSEQTHRVMGALAARSKASVTVEKNVIAIRGANEATLGAIRAALPARTRPMLRSDGAFTLPQKYEAVVRQAVVQQPHNGIYTPNEQSTNSRLLGVDGNEGSVQQPEPHRLSELRREGDKGPPGLAEKLSRISGRSRSTPESTPHDRPDKQQRPLRAGERPVGDAEGAGTKQEEHAAPNPQRTNDDSAGLGGGSRPKAGDVHGQDVAGSESGRGAGPEIAAGAETQGTIHPQRRDAVDSTVGAENGNEGDNAANANATRLDAGRGPDSQSRQESARQSENPVEKAKAALQSALDALNGKTPEAPVAEPAKTEKEVAGPFADLGIRDLANHADTTLTDAAARAIDRFIGVAPGTVDNPNGAEAGLMDVKALEDAYSSSPSTAGKAIRASLETAFAPVRAFLRTKFGGTTTLYRYQAPVEVRDPNVIYGSRGESDTRNVLSWTTDPKVAEWFAGVGRDIPQFTEEQIKAFEDAYERTGTTQITKNISLVRETFNAQDGTEIPYVAIYDQRVGGFVTDTDSVRAYIEQRNADRAERAQDNAARRSKIITAKVALQDVVWISDRAGQAEFIVHNRPGSVAFVGPDGKLAPSEQPRYQRRLNEGDDPVFYSALERAVEASTTARASAEQWAATLSKAAGVKKDEMEWSGIFDWLDAQTGPVSRDDLLRVIRDGGIKVEEVILGEDQEHILERAAEIERIFPGETHESALSTARDEFGHHTQFNNWSSDPNNPTYRELLITLPIAQGGNPTRDFATHWDQPAVIAHTRFMDKTDAEGNRVLFVEEIQSDRGQAIRDKGVGSPVDQEAVADIEGLLAKARAADEQALEALMNRAHDLLDTAMMDAPNSAEQGHLQARYPLDARPRYARERAARDVLVNLGDSLENQSFLDANNVAALRVNELDQALQNARQPKGVPDMPFKSSWPALVLKRLIRYASDNGFDKIAWTTGAEQNERYDLEKHIGRVIFADNSSGGIGRAYMDGPTTRGRLTVYPHDSQNPTYRGGTAIFDRHIDLERDPNALKDVIGAELADRLTNAPPREGRDAGLGVRVRELSGLDLKTGGEGMRGFYDRNLVNIANDLIKKHGGKVEPVDIADKKANEKNLSVVQNFDGTWTYYDLIGYPHSPFETQDEATAAMQADRSHLTTNPGFDITPALADAARSGFPLFQRAQSSPVTEVEAAKIAERLHVELDRLGISDRIALQATNGLLTKGQGSYFRRVIKVSLDAAINPDATLNHESIHAMKALGLFTTSEWSALKNQALADAGIKDFLRGYPTLSDEARAEEAIAEFYARWRSERMQAKGFAAKAFQRLLDFLHALGRAAVWVNGDLGAGTVLRRIEKGKIGRRETGAGVFAEDRPHTLFQGSAFHHWFGKSKVVDENGAPLAVYHGTPNGEFEAFDPARAGSTSASNTSLLGFFFSPDPARVQKWAEGEHGRVVSAYLSIEKPWTIKARDFTSSLHYAYPDREYAREEFGKMVARLRARGFDGIHILADPNSPTNPAYEFGADQWVAFEPTQIKSTANRGTFDPNDPRIMYQGGEDGFNFEAPPSREGMTERQRAEMDARLRQSKIGRLGQQGVGDIAGGLFDAERDQGSLFQVRPTASQWNDRLNRIRDATGALKTIGKRDKIAMAMDKLRINFQDRMLPLLRTQTAIEQVIGRELTDEEQPYRQEALYTGRVGDQFEKLTDGIVEPLFEAMQENNVSVDELESYLYARHAPERNAKLEKEGVQDGSGMSDIEAAAILNRIDQAGKTDALKAVATWFDKLTAFSTDTRVAGGLMAQDQADAWRAVFPNYAPLKGHLELPEEERPDGGQSGLSVKGPESKRAFGRKSLAADILAHAIVQAQEAVVRAEKNRVATELFNLVKANPDPNFWQTHKVVMRKRINKETGQVETYPVTQTTADDAKWTVNLKIGGKARRVTFNRENPVARQAAAAMRRLDEPEMNFRIFQITNQWLSKVNTTLSPDFIVSNIARDLETATANLSGFDMKGLRRDVLASWPKAFAAAERGAFKRGNESEWDQAWKDYSANGGRIAYNQIDSVADLQKQITKKFARIQAKNLTPKEAGLRALEGLKWTFDKIEKANIGAENATRLSVYKNLVDRGVSPKQAAFTAKEITTNFNRRGVYGVLVNSLYLFANASIQGNARMIMALKHRRTQKIAASMVVAGAMVAMFNAAFGGDDDDGVPYYDKISDFEKSTNLIFMLPGTGGHYIKIPMAYGYSIFPDLGRRTVDVVRGRTHATDAIWGWMSNALNSFNPLGGQESVANFLAPTLVDPAVDLMVDNRDFADRPIMPDQSPYGPPVPDSQRYWPSIPPYYRAMSDALNRATGGTQVEPGSVLGVDTSVSPETLQYLVQQATGSAGATVSRLGGIITKTLDGDPETNVELNDVPVVRRLVGQKPSWYDQAAFYARLHSVQNIAAQAREYRHLGDTEGQRQFVAEHRDALELHRIANRAQTEMQHIRRLRSRADIALANGRITQQRHDEIRAAALARQERLFTRWNAIYLQHIADPVNPER